MDGPAIYQHPLAYLVGLQGIALLRAFSGVYDREFALARLDEIGQLLDSGELGEGGEAHPVASREGYALWASVYDRPGNAMIDLEEPVVREIVAALPPGVALDAACGTGRHAAYLASLGHRVIGVDESPEMLALARSKVPAAGFHEADLHEIPLADDSVDLVVCALALAHVPDLGRALRELVRVLRPGGHLVVSDSRGLIGDIPLPLVRPESDGTFGYMRVRAWATSEYLQAALPLGLRVLRCEEVEQQGPIVGDDGTDLHTGEPSPEHVPGGPPDIWALHPLCPAAANAAWLGRPRVIVWQFELAA